MTTFSFVMDVDDNFFFLIFSGLVNVYSTPVVASQHWRLPKEKRRRKRGKKVVKDPSSDSNASGNRNEAKEKQDSSSTASKEVTSDETASSVVTTTPSVNTQMDSDFVRVSASSSLPKTILASQDPEVTEKETEVVDLTVEANSVPSTVTVASMSEKKTSGKAEEKSKSVLASGKKAKSSYR